MAWRGGVDRVERPAVVLHELDGVGAVELERIPRLRCQIDADDVEPGAVVADGAAAGAAE
jgi:hypothetical protein